MLSVTSGLRVKTLRGDGVNLIDEDDRRRVLLGQSEHIADHARTLAEVFLNKL